MPTTPCRWFQLRRTRSVMSRMYSGQQKLATSVRTPPPAPPALLKPKPCPLFCVSAFALPSVGSGPVVGVRPVASRGACCGLAWGGRDRGSGSAIGGGFGAGAVSARRTGSGGGGACTGRPPICVRPPVFGPTAPPRLMVMIVRGGGSGRVLWNTSSAVTTTMCAAIDHTTIVGRRSTLRERAMMTSVTACSIVITRWHPASPRRVRSRDSSTPDLRRFGDEPHGLDASRVQLLDDIDLVLNGKVAIDAEEHLLVGTTQQRLPQPLGEGSQTDRLLAEEDTTVVAERERHVHEQALAGNLLRAARLRQVHFDAALEHRCGHHEDDEQHEHHVYERDHVDLGQSRRDTTAAAAAVAPGRYRLDFRHRSSSGEVPLGDVQELQRKVVQIRRVSLHLGGEVVVGHHGGNRREQARGRRNQRIGDAGTDGREVRRAGQADPLKGDQNPPYRAKQPDERRRARDGRKEGNPFLELVDLNRRRAKQCAVHGGQALEGRTCHSRAWIGWSGGSGDTELRVQFGIAGLENAHEGARRERGADGLHL